MSNEVQRGGGIGFCSLLAILFIGLKLGGVIAWSWVWVLAPLWLPISIVLGFFLFFLIIAGLFATLGK